MGKQERPDLMHKVYRQFSRQKYNKYKHQFPKMRQSDIVSKIIREWDSLGLEGKQKLQKIYETNKFIHDDPSQQDSGYKSVEKVKVEKPALENTQEKSIVAKIEAKEEGESGIMNERYALSEQGSSKKSLDSGRLMTPQSRSKKGSSLGKTDYITFFKYYYSRYKKEHEKWSSIQISKMISLLWAKNKKRYRESRVKKQHFIKTKKSAIGLRLFRKVKKLSSEEAKAKWRRLPQQSRKMLYSPAKQIEGSSSRERVGKMVLKSNPVDSETSVGIFSFLRKVMT